VTAPEPGRGSEQGETLVEILVAVAILGLAATALLGALGTVTTASTLHRQQATAETAIRSYAEAVQAVGYRDCTASLTYTATDVGYVAPAGFAAAVVGVAYWDGTGFSAPGGPPSATAGCPRVTSTSPQLQLVTLEVHSADGKESETVKLTVRSP